MDKAQLFQQELNKFLVNFGKEHEVEFKLGTMRENDLRLSLMISGEDTSVNEQGIPFRLIRDAKFAARDINLYKNFPGFNPAPHTADDLIYKNLEVDATTYKFVKYNHTARGLRHFHLENIQTGEIVKESIDFFYKSKAVERV